MSATDLMIEANHVNPIPDDESHGGPWQQAVLWFGFNVNVFNVVLGAIVVEIGLTFWQSVIGIALGTAIGALLIALHATQGPKLRVVQMIQSRAQFGFDGASFLFAAVLILNFGFIAAQLVIEAQAMNIVVSRVTIPEWILILVPPAVLIGIFGYRWVHRAAQVTAVVVGITIVVMFVQALRLGPLPAAQAGLHAPPAGLFLAGVALLVIDMLSFGPFVSDYSRYLPRQTGSGTIFAGIWTGNFISTVGACVLGAYIAALLPKLGTVGAIGRVGGPAVLVIMALSLVNGCSVNAYTGGMQVLSLAHTFRRWRDAHPSVRTRIGVFLAVMLAGTVAALLGYRSFVNNLSDFLDVLLMLFIPWSAINLTDYFLVRRGHYDVNAFFTPDGVYGRFAWRGLTAYLCGLILEIPFVSQTYFTGFMVGHLGGADISWLVGFIVAAAVYLLLCRVVPDRAAASEPVIAAGTGPSVAPAPPRMTEDR